MHRVFVTGATGFVGRAVIQAVRAEGHAMRCLVRRGTCDAQPFYESFGLTPVPLARRLGRMLR